jgi:hypothetical protein
MPKTPPRCCATCKWYDLPTVKNARGAIMSLWAAQCLWKVGPVPDSARNQRIHCTYMAPYQGITCPCWEKSDDA